jgi:hypothetical protein
MRRRLLWLALGALSVSALVVGTGGFSAAVTDRGVSVAVADHDRALVSIWDPGGPSPEPPMHPGEDPITPNDTRVKLLVVENRIDGATLDLQVRERAGSPVSVAGSYDGLESEDTAVVDADVDCNGHTGRVDAPLTVRATATDGGFHSVIRFDASVVCSQPPSKGGGAQSTASSPSTASTPA